MTATLNIISADKNSLVQRVLASDDSWGTLALRVPVGIIFAAHGAQKLFGLFGGYGLDGTGQWMDSIGLGPGHLMALLAGSDTVTDPQGKGGGSAARLSAMAPMAVPAPVRTSTTWAMPLTTDEPMNTTWVASCRSVSACGMRACFSTG